MHPVCQERAVGCGKEAERPPAGQKAEKQKGRGAEDTPGSSSSPYGAYAGGGDRRPALSGVYGTEVNTAGSEAGFSSRVPDFLRALAKAPQDAVSLHEWDIVNSLA